MVIINSSSTQLIYLVRLFKSIKAAFHYTGSFDRRPKRPIVFCLLYSRMDKKTKGRFDRRIKQSKWKAAFKYSIFWQVALQNPYVHKQTKFLL